METLDGAALQVEKYNQIFFFSLTFIYYCSLAHNFKNSWASINQKVFIEHPLSARVGPEIEK